MLWNQSKKLAPLEVDVGHWALDLSISDELILCRRRRVAHAFEDTIERRSLTPNGDCLFHHFCAPLMLQFWMSLIATLFTIVEQPCMLHPKHFRFPQHSSQTFPCERENAATRKQTVRRNKRYVYALHT